MRQERLPTPLHDTLTDIRSKAEQGDAAAQYRMGQIYENGESLPVNNRVARLVSDGGQTGGCRIPVPLGADACQGKDTPVNQEEALKWYLKAARQNDAHSQWWWQLCTPTVWARKLTSRRHSSGIAAQPKTASVRPALYWAYV